MANTFLGLDAEANFRHDPGGQTRFRVSEVDGEEIGEIVFGPDIFPGTSVVDPNAALGMRAAAAHELSHFHRWRDKTELDSEHIIEIDEALTSLHAIQRYYEHFNDTEIKQLAADAMQRLQIFVDKHRDGFRSDE